MLSFLPSTTVTLLGVGVEEGEDEGDEEGEGVKEGDEVGEGTSEYNTTYGTYVEAGIINRKSKTRTAVIVFKFFTSFVKSRILGREQIVTNN